MKKIVITSGYYNPVHVGHINLFEDAKNLGDYLVVVVNNDIQVKIKNSCPFMPEFERVKIIKAIGCVDEVFLSIDKDGSVKKSLESVFQKYQGNELIFAKGGDSVLSNVPELEICKKFGAKVVLDVGGGKVQSSSWLLAKRYEK
jgi:cytidyltransferase-like protein